MHRGGSSCGLGPLAWAAAATRGAGGHPHAPAPPPQATPHSEHAAGPAPVSAGARLQGAPPLSVQTVTALDLSSGAPLPASASHHAAGQAEASEVWRHYAEALQRDLLLAHTELLFERYLRQQHRQHIRRQYQEQVNRMTQDVERSRLVRTAQRNWRGPTREKAG